MLVGGTMLYFKALREGLHTLPEADAVVRQRIDAEADEIPDDCADYAPRDGEAQEPQEKERKS